MAKITGRLFSSIAVLILAGSPVQAQEWKSGLYFEVGGGLSLVSDTDATQLGIPFSTSTTEGFIFSGALGKQFDNVHVEAEALYSENEFDQINIFGASPKLSGDTSVIAGLVNVYYDFDFGRNWRPFLGGGFGFAQVSINNASSLGVPIADDEDRTIAYQLKAGISYSLSEHTDFVVSYRFLNSGDLDFSDASGIPISSDGIEAHGVEARFRVRF
ncbi:MAG TPA: outer membrane beta-barrel protein [Gammaproteobacteria bacterium]|nr:outer membrane beta-barrel protein [Gammaproteobacteria bacterium]